MLCWALEGRYIERSLNIQIVILFKFSQSIDTCHKSNSSAGLITDNHGSKHFDNWGMNAGGGFQENEEYSTADWVYQCRTSRKMNKKCIRALPDPSKLWPRHLQTVSLALNTSVVKCTGKAPLELQFGLSRSSSRL
jgi:hypothetical protein